ncbi:MAG: DUF393 domain-containing protein [Pseudanabaenaceae cyanobacterium SKYGB_i_bin29]|nr:DUF393 domain-containing protein [Pseudanabaenaceae cyanobacterium SKYG29]MDW8421159.1 DUF393 domain-containing protein [Pseudanabaenaceae cyanobacterium SKYGB_i_bin29]
MMTTGFNIVIYDGNCNLCTTFVKLMETIDRGRLFRYVPMQKEELLQELGVNPEEMAQGVILLEGWQEKTGRKYQGMAAIERIGELLPGFPLLVQLYNQIPGVKPLVTSGYAWVRDHRYQLFGQCPIYESQYPFCRPCPTLR